METTSKWDLSVIKQVTTKNNFGIVSVRRFQSIKELYFENNSYSNIVNLIKENNFKAIEEIPQGEKKSFREYLSIITFRDQDERKYVMTIYDSDELYQDPEIMEIFPL